MNPRSLRHALLVPAALLGLLLAARADAQVLDQVPANAIAVFKVKNLDAVNAKAAKMAQAFGLDQLAPDLKDPLGSMLQKGHITQGVNKAGDMALVFFDPEATDAKSGKAMLALVPTNDYKAFVANFKGGAEEKGITKGQAPADGAGNEDVFIAHWGDYAAVTPTQSLLNQKPSGLKLTGQAAKEAETKDAILYANMDAVRKTVLPKLKAERQNILNQITKNLGNDEKAKQFAPVMRVLVEQYLNVAEQFLTDSTSGVLSFNLENDGIATAALAEFKPDSQFGRDAAQLKGDAGASLLSGLPNRKYFAVAGYSADPKTMSSIMGRLLDPVAKELNNAGEEGKSLAGMVDTFKSLMAATRSTTMGYVVPTGPLGQESVIQTVGIIKGDAKTIAKDERQLIETLGTFMKQVPQGPGAPAMDFEYTPNAKTIAGVALDNYTMNMKVDANDPRAAQMQQVMAMMYGPNGMGGTWGAVDGETFIAAQGASDKLLAELIASAKNPQDNFSTTPGVKAVAAHLPKQRLMEGYVQVDNIIGSVVKYAAGLGFPIKVKLPPNLPPIGMAATTDGPSVRVDSFVPSSLVESLIAAGIEAYTNFQGGAGGAGGPGGL